MTTPTLIVKRRKIANVLSGEPWIYPNAIVDAPVERGLVRVLTEEAKHIGWADFNPQAPICARLLSREQTWMGDEKLLAQRIQQALWRRISIGMQPQGNGLRLVNSEGDGLPGLVVDVFGGTIVIDLFSAGMAGRAELICEVLRQFLGDLALVVRMNTDAAAREGLEAIAPAKDTPITFAENGVVFRFELSNTQKSGFYLDQRDNRRMAACYSRDRRVLDLFCYHGGFALSCLAAGAQSAIAVDSSEPALAYCQANAEYNGLAIDTRQEDVFDFLEQLANTSERFDLVICDPPKLAPRKADRQKGLKAYRYLIDRSLRVLSPNGLLMVSSCSAAIGSDDLQRIINQQANKSGLAIDVLQVTGQPADHPWPIGFRTGRYLSTLMVHLRAVPAGT